MFVCFQGEEAPPGVGQHHILLFLSGVWMQILEGFFSWSQDRGTTLVLDVERRKEHSDPQVVAFGGFVAAALAP